MLGDGVLEADRLGTTYAGKIHHTVDGAPCFMAWHRYERDGTFAGYVTAPRGIEVAADGTLAITDPETP
jgi:hypothetical protein